MGSRYQPIEDYGLIGNLRTAALVGMDGSLEVSGIVSATPPASASSTACTSAARCRAPRSSTTG